ncbi:PTS glucitol/sorbitol transporter subunit IIA [Terrilactibacillus laevilacticus]|uniref:PTS glucitol/sorbitol transporter subunit IIA n=1 Tax=Terrilactibacillus laevilacticus TaxID=1380157 RepID=A0ABW5PRR3_9BACI|nr:PTS glucitol/sorbitol transporter subunit IIA [Terrilactibacillus laevilacticus]
MSTIYENKIQSIGEMAKEFFSEKMLILFGNEAPDGLKDYCFGIDVKPLNGDIKVGNKVFFNNQSYDITAVGNLVQKNLVELGHITMKFDGSESPELAGTLYLENKEVPDIDLGTKIEIK